MKKIIIGLIRVYQHGMRPVLAQLPLFPSSGCRSLPTCSDYAILVVERDGVMKGGFKAIQRVLRCNPLTTPTFSL